MQSNFVRLLLGGFAAVLIQIILLRHLQVFNSESDLVLLYLLWVCTKSTKTEAIFLAAILGLFQDALIDLWGLHMFSKTFLIFLIHGFLSKLKEQSLLIWQIFLIVLGSALFHNLILLGVTAFSDRYATGFVFWSFVFGSSLFTAIIGSFLHLVKID